MTLDRRLVAGDDLAGCRCAVIERERACCSTWYEPPPRSCSPTTVTDEQLIAHSKSSEDSGDAVQVVVDLDPFDAQAGRLELPLDEFRQAASRPYQMDELPAGGHCIGHGSANFVPLDPQGVAAHVLRLRPRIRSERDLTYLM
jgi:hypothetical protein